MAEPIAEFEGRELDEPVRLSLYDTHIEISLERGESGVTIKIPIEELARSVVTSVEGVPVLVIEDTSGIEVAALAMDPPDAARAQRLLTGLGGSKE